MKSQTEDLITINVHTYYMREREREREREMFRAEVSGIIINYSKDGGEGEATGGLGERVVRSSYL